MKKVIILFSLLVAANVASAVEVKGARVNEAKETLELDIAYGGGCEEHTFDLTFVACLQTNPVQCSIKIKDTSKTPDMCEAYIHKTVEFNLKDYGLTESYYKNGTLTIMGSSDTEVTVRLP